LVGLEKISSLALLYSKSEKFDMIGNRSTNEIGSFTKHTTTD